MKLGKYAVLALSFFIANFCYAGTSQCPSHYYDGQLPEMRSSKMQNKAREVCFIAYGLMHSGVTRTPLWSAEYVTQENLLAGSDLKRINSFHPEYALPEDERAEMKDYARTGYDRGHMSPSKDMPTREAQQESFSLANMVPQDPTNNRVLWEGIESAVRTLAKRRGGLYVISGPLFSKTRRPYILNDRVTAPAQLFKIVFDPKKEQGAAYLVDNVNTMQYQTISIAELESLAEIEFFPGMSNQTKNKVMRLPKPTPHRRKSAINDITELFN